MAVSTKGGAWADKPASGPEPPRPRQDEFEEVSLVDILRVLYRRRLLFAAMVALSLLAGIAAIFLTTPAYEAEVAVLPLEHEEVIRNWLDSRQAAEFAASTAGARLNALLYPDEWDSASGTWSGPEPARSDIAVALMGRVEVSRPPPASSRATQPIEVTVTLTDPTAARDIAAAYIGSLDLLRPQLENISRSELFDRYYDGSNEQEAQRRAETAAREKSYWLVFDSPTVPDNPVKPRPTLYMALATVLGLVAGMVLVFVVEWVSKYRGEFQRV